MKKFNYYFQPEDGEQFHGAFLGKTRVEADENMFATMKLSFTGDPIAVNSFEYQPAETEDLAIINWLKYVNMGSQKTIDLKLIEIRKRNETYSELIAKNPEHFI